MKRKSFVYRKSRKKSYEPQLYNPNALKHVLLNSSLIKLQSLKNNCYVKTDLMTMGPECTKSHQHELIRPVVTVQQGIWKNNSSVCSLDDYESTAASCQYTSNPQSPVWPLLSRWLQWTHLWWGCKHSSLQTNILTGPPCVYISPSLISIVRAKTLGRMASITRDMEAWESFVPGRKLSPHLLLCEFINENKTTHRF